MTKEQEAIKELKDNGFTVIKNSKVTLILTQCCSKGETATLMKLYQKIFKKSI